MPVIPIPLVKGQGKSPKNADYIDLLPTNILPVVREAEGANGYFRFFPGIDKSSDVDGISRGAHFNVFNGSVYRVMGGKLYGPSGEAGDVLGNDRVAMDNSRVSQAVAANGELILYRYDGSVKNLSNWPPGDPQYNWGDVFDMCRHRGRYVWTQKGSDTFWVTSLEDESHPDKIAPAYRAETQEDGILAVRSYRDYVVCFGSSTIEFFRLTGDANNLFISQSSYMVDVGIAGQFAITNYLESFAFITNASSGQHQIAVMGQGNYKVISNYHINNILEKYTSEQLSTTVLESLKFDVHNLLIAHLPEETVVYDSSSGLWSLIKSGLYDGAHRGIDYWNEGGLITCGDKFSGLKGKLSESSSSQYGEDQEVILYTPLIIAEGAHMHDLEITPNSGLAAMAQRIFISVTEDGVNYSRNEALLEYDNKFEWLKRSIYDWVGEVEYRIGFKLRIVGSDPATLSNLRVRVE